MLRMLEYSCSKQNPSLLRNLPDGARVLRSGSSALCMYIAGPDKNPSLLFHHKALYISCAVSLPHIKGQGQERADNAIDLSISLLSSKAGCGARKSRIRAQDCAKDMLFSLNEEC